MVQAMRLNVHAVSDLGGRGETPWNPPGADSEAVGQRFDSSRAHHLAPVNSEFYGWGLPNGLGRSVAQDHWRTTGACADFVIPQCLTGTFPAGRMLAAGELVMCRR